MIAHERLTFRRFIDTMFMLMIVAIGAKAVSQLDDLNVGLARALEKINHHDQLIKDNSRKIEKLRLK